MEDSIGAALAAMLIERIGAQRFELWFESQTSLTSKSNNLIVRAKSPFVRDWLRANFADDLEACWEKIVGNAGSIEFELTAPSRPQAAPPIATSTESKVPAAPVRPAKTSRCERPGSEHPDSRAAQGLSDFVVGPSNEYAFRAAELTAFGRQQASPLTLCGPTGVGKTHLLRGILREYRRRHPRSSALYMTAEQFTTNFVEALHRSGLPSFRQKCRGAQLLLIDDLHFFVGKQRTVEELQHTIDNLLAEGKQLVLAGDRALGELRGLGAEMVSRLAGGLTCEIEPPEFATRVGILQRLTVEMQMVIDKPLLCTIATHIADGARELRGALHRLQAMSLACDEPIGPALVERALSDLARYNRPAVRLPDVQKAVCDVFGVEPSQLRSDRKGRSVSEPRMLAMWLARKYTRAAWGEIGEFFGRRSHSTVISAHQRVEKLITSQAYINVSDRSCRVEDAIRRVESALRTA